MSQARGPDQCNWVQVVTAVDPFGYYAEGVQQHLDEAFTSPKGRSRCVFTDIAQHK